MLKALSISFAFHAALFFVGWRVVQAVGFFESREFLARNSIEVSPVIVGSSETYVPMKKIANTTKSQKPRKGSGAPSRITLDAMLEGLNEPPAYPEQALALGLEGLVEIEIGFAADGVANEVRIAKSSGHLVLDTQAEATASQWRLPESLQNKGIQRIVVPVDFVLVQ